MNVRSAKISVAKAINALINSYAERNRMSFRSLANIYENLQTFIAPELPVFLICQQLLFAQPAGQSLQNPGKIITW